MTADPSRVTVDYEVVIDYAAKTGESPIWSVSEQDLYWIDIQQPALHRFDPVTGRDRHWLLPDEVGCYALKADGSGAILEKYLRAGTRFYLEGAKASLSDPASLKAVIAGPTIEMVPGEGGPTRSFVGISGEAPERLAVSVPYRIIFDGPVGALKPGDPVILRGFKVGEVTKVDLGVDPTQGVIHTATEIALDPPRFHLKTAEPGANWPSAMNAALTSLIEHHWRARLTQSPPLIGPRQIELAIVPEAPPASLTLSAGIWEIPTATSSGLDHLIQAPGQFPLEEIGDNVRAITEHIKTLSAAPEIKDSTVHLDNSLKQLDQTLKAAGPKVAPTLQSVHDTVDRLKVTAGELDKTVTATRALIGTDAAAPDGSLEPTLQHVSEAARAIRELADYLDAHPESLIKGRLK